MKTGFTRDDYGYYGKTGTFATDRLPTRKCTCGFGPVIEAKYDDTPGFRETVYCIRCDNCDTGTIETSDIERIIEDWNENPVHARRIH